MIIGARCWGAGDNDQRDVISNEREDLIAALRGTGSRWDAIFGCREENDRKNATWKE